MPDSEPEQIALQPILRRILLVLISIYVGALILVTLIEIIRLPVGACALDAASAACLRHRVIVILPWIGMGVAFWLLYRQSRRAAILRQTAVYERDSRVPLARLFVLSGPPALIGKNISISAGVTTIGRDPSCADIVFYSPRDRSTVSGLHCTLSYDRGRFSLTDQRSANGTSLNGRAIAPGVAVTLRAGDEIVIGDAARLGVVVRFQPVKAAMSILPESDFPEAEPLVPQEEDVRRTFAGSPVAPRSPASSVWMSLAERLVRAATDSESETNGNAKATQNSLDSENPADWQSGPVDDSWMKEL